MKKRNLLLLLSLTVASLSAYSQACFNSANDYVFEGPSSSRCITKADFDNDVADPNTDTTADDFRQDLEIKVTRAGSLGAKTKK